MGSMIRKRGIAALMSIVLLFGLSSPAFAATTRKQISITYGISLMFNDSKASLTDVNGNSVQPFVWQGTTYVPIRGVAQLFGADVSYDSKTNTALIYDDFAEVCAVVNRMNNIVNESYNHFMLEMLNASTKGLEDLTDSFKECDTDIKNMYETLQVIAEDNGNYSLISDGILMKYQDFLLKFVKSENTYRQLRKNPTSYYANQFADAAHDTIDAYSTAVDAMETFFKDYCCWRDLGF